MDIGTYSAIQTVKFVLRTKEKGSVKTFSQKDVIMVPVDPKLCINTRTSSKWYREDLSKAEATREEKKQRCMITLKAKSTKAEHKRKIFIAQKHARKAHVHDTMEK